MEETLQPQQREITQETSIDLNQTPTVLKAVNLTVMMNMNIEPDMNALALAAGEGKWVANIQIE
jgi:hypothetical protein|tara:strand:+ start:1788 stop:1979 length:192 start_codon:yes stop_codon:yes gene_type:complete